MHIYSLHLYTMITSNHDSGTCLSIAYTFIQWLLPIMIQVYVYIAYTFIPWLLVIMIQVHVYPLFARLYHDYSNHDSGTFISIANTFIHDSGICIYSLHVYTMITSNHDSGTCISIACTFIPWLLLIIIQVHVYLYLTRLYHDYFQSWFRYMYINSLHVYTMITSNHDSGTCISIAYTFIPWLLLIMIQVHVYL